MASPEIPSFNLETNEDDLDLRAEKDVFPDHERPVGVGFSDAALQADRETLADEEDGIIYIKLPVYNYDQSKNPFIGMGPHTIRLYEISRHLDVTFLHRFMYGSILVRGLRSGEYVSKYQRKKFVKHIKETGGLPVSQLESQGFDFEALRFAPYVASDTTRAIFDKYHLSDEYAGVRPHLPVDVWLVHDINAYELVGEESDNKLAKYALKEDYDRGSSLLAVAVIN